MISFSIGYYNEINELSFWEFLYSFPIEKPSKSSVKNKEKQRSFSSNDQPERPLSRGTLREQETVNLFLTKLYISFWWHGFATMLFSW